MPSDIEIAESIAEKLSLARDEFGHQQAQFLVSFDEIVESEDVKDPMVVRITPASFQQTLAARGVWHDRCWIGMTFEAPQVASDYQSLVSKVKFVDSVLKYARKENYLGKRPILIEIDPRVDEERLRDNNQFFSRVLIGFNLIGD